MDANNVRQQLEQVVVQCGFNLVTEKSDKLSHYYEFRHKGALTMTVIRISNHCTDISTWSIILPQNRTGSARKINPIKTLSEHGQQLKKKVFSGFQGQSSLGSAKRTDDAAGA